MHIDTFVKATMSMDVKPIEIGDDIKINNVVDDVKPSKLIDAKVCVRPVVVEVDVSE